MALDERAQIRLLINDPGGDDPVFSDTEIDAFYLLEGSNVKMAAAQALDTIADDEALTSKVIKDHDLQTDGTKVADSLRKRAATLRSQAADQAADADGGSFFQIVDVVGCRPAVPELTERPADWCW